MIRHYLHIVLATLILLVSGNVNLSKATHAQSADISYTCIGGNQYNIQLSFYRDCAGVNAPNTVTINVSSATCGQNFNITLNRVPGTGIDVTPICPNITTNCNGGNYPGVQEWVYSGPVTLPAQCTDWTFSFTLCCRNNAISTINNPGGENIFVSALLDNLNFPCNNSPQFSNKPIPFICVNQTYCFNHGAVDPDGDSLVYQLVPAATGPTTNVTYQAGYSATQPLLSNPAISIDPINGDICMTPTMLDVGVMAVRVLEYRNGELVGSVVRDIQVRVINCTNNLPYISGINGTNNFSIGACAGQPLSFDILSFDIDQTQNVTLNWNNAIPGATFTTGPGSRPTGTFTWTPATNQISNNPYCFTVTVTDDNCPLNGTQTFSFCITVSGLQLNLSTTNANCGASNGSATVTPIGQGPFTYQWSSGGNQATANGLQAGTYTVAVTNSGGCTATATAVVGQGAAPGNIQMNSIPVSCFGGNDGAATANVNGGQQPYTYQWSNGGTGATITGLTPGTYDVTVTTANGCVTTGSVTVTQPLEPVTLQTTVIPVTCFGGNDGSATVIANGGSGNFSYSWNTTPVQNSATATGLGAGNYSVTVQDGNGCMATATINLQQAPQLNLNLTSFSNATCFGLNNGSAAYTANGGTGQLTINWSNGWTGSSQGGLSAGNYTITVTDANNCATSQNLQITEPPQLQITVDAFQDVSCSGLNDAWISVNTIGGTAPLNINWNNNPTFSGNTINSLNAGSYTATVTDANGCSASVTQNIQSPSPITLTLNEDTTICPGVFTQVIAQANGGTGVLNYNWNNNLGNQNSHSVSPNTTTTYTVNITDANGCQGPTDSVRITINDISTIQFGITGTQGICEGEVGIVLMELAGGFGNYTINWNNGLPPTVGPHQVSPGTGTTYTATITDICGNSRTESFFMDVFEVPEVSLSPGAIEQCGKAEINVSNNSTNLNGSSYLWHFGDGSTSTDETADHTYTQSGLYTVVLEVTSAQGCYNADTTQYNVLVKPNALADFEPSTRSTSIFDAEIRFTNLSTQANNYQWDLGDGTTTNTINVVHRYMNEGTYTVTLIANNPSNCPDTLIDEIVIGPEFTYYLPNAFTPDGDGINDTFYGKGDHIREFEMMIFDRWGEQIFTANTPNQAWDGTYKGGEPKPDVYVYKIKVIDDIKGERHFFEGHVTLIR